MMPSMQNELEISDGCTLAVKTISGLFFKLSYEFFTGEVFDLCEAIFQVLTDCNWRHYWLK